MNVPLNKNIENATNLERYNPLYGQVMGFKLIENLLVNFINKLETREFEMIANSLILMINSFELSSSQIYTLLLKLPPLPFKERQEIKFENLFYVFSPLPTEEIFEDIIKQPCSTSFYQLQVSIAKALRQQKNFQPNVKSINEFISLCVCFNNVDLLRWAFEMANRQHDVEINSFLPYAVKYDSPNLFELLIQKGASVLGVFENFEEEKGLTVIEMALLYKKERFINHYFERGYKFPNLDKVTNLIRQDFQDYLIEIKDRIIQQSNLHHNIGQLFTDAHETQLKPKN